MRDGNPNRSTDIGGMYRVFGYIDHLSHIPKVISSRTWQEVDTVFRAKGLLGSGGW